MEIKTKYNLGDKVYQIHSYSKEEFAKCPACEGRGHVYVNEFKFTCEKCYGHGGTAVYPPVKWHVSNEVGKIGKIEATLYANKYLDDWQRKNETRYMLDITGVGSGTCYYEDNLYSTEDEAIAECDRRNKEATNAD